MNTFSKRLVDIMGLAKTKSTSGALFLGQV